MAGTGLVRCAECHRGSRSILNWVDAAIYTNAKEHISGRLK